MKKIAFAKMHGLGNDFVIINASELAIDPADIPIKQLANRNLGIGFDQLLLLKVNGNEFYCQIFNADGSEAEQCGNGLRCLARYIKEHGITDKNEIHITTVAGTYPIKIKDYDTITVNMGMPSITEKTISIGEKSLPVSILNLGNPHAIVNVEDLGKEDTREIATQIANSNHFQHGANVGFIEVINPNQLRLRTFERGAGETFACGSNACAAAVAGISNGWVDSPVQIDFPYGILQVSWKGADYGVELTGSATHVFNGEINL